MKKIVLKVHPKDNVIVALRDLEKGEIIDFEGSQYEMQEKVQAKHKFYTEDLPKGSEVIMYGVLVGKVQFDVKKGGLMTTDNLHHAADPYAYRDAEYKWTAPDVSKYAGRTFNGYHRTDGRVGTANYWLFIPTVFCENRNLDVIREAMHNELGYAVTDKYKRYTRMLKEAYEKGEQLDSDAVNLSAGTDAKASRLFKNVDGIKFLNHQGGCGGTRQDSAILENLLAAYADHPNVGGITVLSLGCQHLQVSTFVDTIKKRNPGFDKPIHIFEQQGPMSEEELIKHAICYLPSRD
jgi:altronate hydrolase